jgi:ACT domain-containing protein
VIVHAYLTSGFFPWAKIFLESYKYHNGEDNRVILSTRCLKDQQLTELYNIYSNLQIINTQYSIKNMAAKAGITQTKMLKYKNEVETNHVTMENKVWKLMIAADDRVKSIRDVLQANMNEDYMFHSDIDMYIRAPLTELFDFIKQHEISIRLRLKSKLNRRTMIGIQGYKIGKKALNFLNSWIKHVENIKPKDRPLGYGQTSCYYAYKEFVNNTDWGSVPRKFIAPQMKETDIIWSANTSQGKTKNLEICYEDFEGIKNGTKINHAL